jgi:hypothetical protein
VQLCYKEENFGNYFNQEDQWIELCLMKSVPYAIRKTCVIFQVSDGYS